MTFPRLTATEHEIEQTRRICELRGWRYYSSTDARTDDAHVFDGAGREETLLGGRFTLEHVVAMLEAENVNWQEAGRADSNSDAGAIFPKCGWYKDWEDDLGEALVIAADYPFDLTLAMDALLALEKRKGTEKP